MKYRLIISPRAESDFENQFLYLAERTVKGANAWAVQYEVAVKKLSDSPEQHGLAPEDSDHQQEIRQLLFKTPRGNPYRLLFTIRGCEVLILTIRGSGQGFAELADD